ncbi:MAG: cell division regulator GpsB [Bacilli bacterium]|nr:cell division regulator GpsB [Bacilli bacterium]MDD4809467.1 cell division regulator GpsB [Bacilli bacterium]
MYQERILLTTQDLLDKEFKIDTRGYRPQEVDKFLDIIIRDYGEFVKLIRELDTEKKELIHDNMQLKQEIRKMKTQIEVLKEGTGSDTTNSDLLRRLSNLEKVIYGKE